MMKKTKALLALMLLFAFTFARNALGEKDGVFIKYDFAEIGVSVLIPDGFDVLTRYSSDDDPIFDEYEMDPEYIRSSMIDVGMYLNAILPDGSKSLIIFITETDDEDFSLMNKEELYQTAASYAEILEEKGVPVNRTDIYNSAKSPFVCLWESEAPECDVLRCLTKHNGLDIDIGMCSYDGEITYADEVLMAVIMANLSFMENYRCTIES